MFGGGLAAAVRFAGDLGARLGRASRPPPPGLTVNGSGRGRPLYTVQWRGERSYHIAGLERDIDTEPAVHVMAEIFALADYVGGVSGDSADWSDLEIGSVVRGGRACGD